MTDPFRFTLDPSAAGSPSQPEPDSGAAPADNPWKAPAGAAPPKPEEALFQMLFDSARAEAVRRIPISGANVADVDATAEFCAWAIQFCARAVEESLKRLNDSLPITEPIDVRDFVCGMRDLKSDLLGQLDRAADRMMGY